MSLTFHTATEFELNTTCKLYRSVTADMKRQGLKQWQWGQYPNEDILRQDIQQKKLYLMEEDGKIIGAFVLSPHQEPEYAQLTWHFGIKPLTMHRMALSPDCFGLGLAHRMLVFARQEGLRLGYDSLRADATQENKRALKLLRGAMKREAGTIHAPFSSMPYHCFETPLSDDCPLLPIRMHPAYRHGDMTPWGGDALKHVFGKPIPDSRTGEALEISTIPGLESVDDMGMPLPRLITRYGRRMIGKNKVFPLLLKLIDARDTLSVQVHPNDAYAYEHENGKLGKSEAWVILHANEGAKILYGIKRGFHRKDLIAALDAKEDIEPMIESVPVHAGDVFYIPSGMVHAIGSGIVLYEIQQSSDVTYRLWDYMRVNAQGQPRELHINQAMDVINTRLLGEQSTLPTTQETGVHRLLSVPAFALDCACTTQSLPLPERPGRFRLLTALNPLHLCWKDACLKLNAGESAFLSAHSPALWLEGNGRALIACAR